MPVILTILEPLASGAGKCHGPILCIGGRTAAVLEFLSALVLSNLGITNPWHSMAVATKIERTIDHHRSSTWDCKSTNLESRFWGKSLIIHSVTLPTGTKKCHVPDNSTKNTMPFRENYEIGNPVLSCIYSYTYDIYLYVHNMRINMYNSVRRKL